MSFAAVVVTYFPDRDALAHLESLARSCPRLIVIDNTPAPTRTPFPASVRPSVLGLGRNIGLAAALDLGLRRAGAEGFEDVFLFDQDSRAPKGYFAGMLEFKRIADGRAPAWAMIVPDYVDRSLGTRARLTVLGPLSCRIRTCAELRRRGLGPKEALAAVTSGALVSYSRYLDLGGFRSDYFIGFVDIEYCLRAWRRGFRVALNCGQTLDHAIGRRTRRRFLGLTIKVNPETPSRRYYNARNGLRTALDYFSTFPMYLPFILASLSLETFSILLYEKDRVRKFAALLRGLLHGWAGRMGPDFKDASERAGTRSEETNRSAT